MVASRFFGFVAMVTGLLLVLIGFSFGGFLLYVGIVWGGIGILALLFKEKRKKDVWELQADTDRLVRELDLTLLKWRVEDVKKKLGK